MSKVDFERFEDALAVRARQSTSEVAGTAYAYQTGYLLSMLQELSHFNPQVAERVKVAIECLERDMFESTRIDEGAYLQ